MHGNATCAHYNRSDKIAIRLRPPDSEIGDFTVCDVCLAVTCWLSRCLFAQPLPFVRPWVLPRALARRATVQVLEARRARYPLEGALSRLIEAWLRGSTNRGNRVMPVSHVLAREI